MGVWWVKFCCPVLKTLVCEFARGKESGKECCQTKVYQTLCVDPSCLDKHPYKQRHHAADCLIHCIIILLELGSYCSCMSVNLCNSIVLYRLTPDLYRCN
ncbi:GRB2-related adapter protein 2 [Platysternon megacephalum]|uniref:GRB2-related adapter protein 2 n=1 Tax=Platysternon megacephalum TaxID=55544 RepID=A0A4D9EBN3_9SAUR|nr:GRB2-related adapter protein 2 [Platysternon megacephalum]